MRFKPNERAFTLIELLIVVSLIGILTGLVISVVDSQGLRARARDGQRASDLKKIQIALELYFADFRNYPTSAWNNIDCSGAGDVLCTAIQGVYLDDFPVDPSNNVTTATPCANTGGYRYNYRSDGSDYLLTAIMEDAASNNDNQCHDLSRWSDPVFNNSGCEALPFDTSDVCYGVSNP
jgi:prepilin-type N-terminal cleavage/methylation domain-containing protein